MSIWEKFTNGYTEYWDYLKWEILNPTWKSYFYWLIGISLFFFLIELLNPWRKDQPKFRKDFWLDAFYMFFNFFLFGLIVYHAASNIVVDFFNSQILNFTEFDLSTVNPMYNFPLWTVLLIGFLIRDFVQWWIHRLLHRVPFLWNFHKIHHSVEQMGFAAHLRYHWMENIVYRTLEYLPLALLGIELYEFFIIHIFTLAVGHFNHSNLKLNIGPLKYIFNNPQMHIWHHIKHLPKEQKYGVNFGLTLSIWDYIFKTNYIPHDGRDIEIGVEDKVFPKGFLGQLLYGFFWKGKL